MTRPVLAIVLAALVVAAGCGDGGDASPPLTTAVETTVETPSPPPPAPQPKSAQPKAVVIDVDQGRPRGGIQRPKLEQGAKVVLLIRSDLGEAVHVHGYDIERPMASGKPLRIPLTLTIAGRFEVELHHPDALLAVLEVRP